MRSVKNIRSFDREAENAALQSEFCIIGAGAAGQTVARHLAYHGREVVLVESGLNDFDANTQELADGDQTAGSHNYYPLRDARLRLYGGSTAIWGGRCAALDPIDYERRPWVPYSGWPVTYEEIRPYTKEAFRRLGVVPASSLSDLGLDASLDASLIDQPLWAFDDRAERFTSTADELAGLGVEIVMGASLTSLDVSENGTVGSAVFRNFQHAALTVRARHYVLATGGIENARLLLAAAPARPDGLGNGRGLVGRYFMEHPHARIGEVVPSEKTKIGAGSLLRLFPKYIFRNKQRYAPALRPSEAAQRERGLLNTAATIALRRREGQPQARHQRLIASAKHGLPATKLFRRTYHSLKQASLHVSAATYPRPQAGRYARKQNTHGLFVVARAEQAPNPDSRVLLSRDTDRFGMRKARLDWRLSEIDKHSARGLVECLDQALRGMGAGTALPSPWLDDPDTLWKNDPLVSSHAIGGYHHMGTTRMAATPSEGVVDANGKLFESPNLYLAGSSVFPTGGWANPTLTIIALALRLGDHLAAQR
ncbi:FAD-dependent oxidoreductase [Parvularcula maris]|uniref:FAD-dependent oxidoreductase n=1 Tax=Parvularcula maris TaxID=2965077 RepID=A0A9X2LBE5_9PROT|nr:FAD-dependent oxidoreductase [Parvularcula maris]MCQ8186461.1 FAD-dependent oxidoreductase [Parvularcula maris]